MIEAPADSALLLANAGSSCKIEYEQRIWSALFGALPLTELDTESYFKDQKKSYRLRHQMRWSDMAITLLGGWALSVSTRTWTVESCISSGQIMSAEQKKREQEAALLAIAKAGGNPLLVIMHNDQRYLGELKTVTPEHWVLIVEDENKDADDKERSFDELILKNGKIISGKVVAQSTHSIRFKSAIGTRRYLKSDIQKISFNKILDDIKTRDVFLEKDKIERVYFKH
ncbi:MAG: hypothetical protein KDK39_09015 [Leptospiraceae bacterium]|nr:hypothetical protein [Leptospiraceae bacterium]